jgi:serine/threonine protein kinase
LSNPQDERELQTGDSAGESNLLGQRWQVLEQIGTGGMSIVYKAKHLILKKIVAVKILQPHLAKNDQIVRRFQQEAEAASRLKHPNIIEVFDCGTTESGEVFMIMDYLEGKSLADVIDTEGIFAPERAHAIFVQAVKALAHAHSHGVVHRDLKPSNFILINENGLETLKVVDFGIAKILDETKQNLTKTGEIFGSPLYMSPEQWQGQELDARADIYSFGCVMYETLTGFPPFSGINPVDTMNRHLHDNPKPFIEMAKRNPLTRRMEEICFRCLEKDPEHRYQSMDELLRALKDAQSATDEAWKRGNKAAKGPRQAAQTSRLIVLWLVAFGLFAILASILVWALPMRVPDEQAKKEPLISMVKMPPLKDPRNFDADLTRIRRVQIVGAISNETAGRQKLVSAKLLADYGRWLDAALEYKEAASLLPDVAFRGRSDALKPEGICLYWQAQEAKDANEKARYLKESYQALSQSIECIMNNKAVFLTADNLHALVLSPFAHEVLEPFKYLAAILENSTPAQLQSALKFCREVSTIYETQSEKGDSPLVYAPQRAQSYAVQADILRLLGKQAEAESATDAAVGLLEQSHLSPAIEARDIYYLASIVYGERAQATDSERCKRAALRCAQEALSQAQSVSPDDSQLKAKLELNLSRQLWRTGDFVGALAKRVDAGLLFIRSAKQ